MLSLRIEDDFVDRADFLGRVDIDHRAPGELSGSNHRHLVVRNLEQTTRHRMFCGQATRETARRRSGKSNGLTR